MQMGVGIRQSVADVDTDSLLRQNWPPSPPVRWRSCSETDSATTEKHGWKKPEKTRTGRYGIPNFRRFRKSLATSSSKNYNLQRVNVIISLPYIGKAKQGAKHTKKSPCLGGTHTRQYSMILVGQIVQQSTRPCIITPPHKRVVVLEHVTNPDRNKKNPETKTRSPTHQHNPMFVRASMSADAT